MKRIAKAPARFVLFILSPLLFLGVAVCFAISDAIFRLKRREPLAQDRRPDTGAVSIVIPNWNGRDLLANYLPSVIEAIRAVPRSEIIVVDNGSADGSVEFLRETFPEVRALALEENLGFGGGSNAGFGAARNDIVVLLNNDMRVAPDFLQPLLDTFTDEKVFAASCQIFFKDPEKPRQETGLTQGWWENGQLRVRHRADPEITSAYPCFYGGGGSCAFDRRKFLELGGFDEILAPFYLEDTDLGYMAWKRGWKVLYQPHSRVWHEHRGTIGRKFSDHEIQTVLKKNYLVWCWKDIHEWRRLASHLAAACSGVWLSAILGDAPLRPNLRGFIRALRRLPEVMRSRRRALALASVSDTEAFRRPMGGYYRDRFAELPAPRRELGVLFVSPYPIFPPVHGGGVFMYQTVVELAKLADVHLVVMLDWPHQLEPHLPIRDVVSSVEFLVRSEYRTRRHASMQPFAVTAFRNEDLEWLIHRQMFTKNIDVVQLEYTVMAQYAGGFQRIPCMVFEHDVYFQSVARGLKSGAAGVNRVKAAFEYLRALRFELRVLPQADRVQVCSSENRRYLEEFIPELKGRIDDNLRAGIDTGRYEFRPFGREPRTMLFLGMFRHTPNQEALDWFLRDIMPRILERVPDARLKIVGSELPPDHSLAQYRNVDVVGFVDDVREPLSRYSLFVCPILSGSGIRVKLLEAFASGIPVVSTRLGAEGLDDQGRICALADNASDFASRAADLLMQPEAAADLSARARDFVVRERDIRIMTRRLVDSYEAEAARMRGGVRTPEPHLAGSAQ
jgi:GT2 family glycosyltransferase/glycosyltransferase involved in cell wall biosynthesis